MPDIGCAHQNHCTLKPLLTIYYDVLLLSTSKSLSFLLICLLSLSIFIHHLHFILSVFLYHLPVSQTHHMQLHDYDRPYTNLDSNVKYMSKFMDHHGYIHPCRLHSFQSQNQLLWGGPPSLILQAGQDFKFALIRIIVQVCILMHSRKISGL